MVIGAFAFLLLPIEKEAYNTLESIKKKGGILIDQEKEKRVLPIARKKESYLSTIKRRKGILPIKRRKGIRRRKGIERRV